MDVEVRRVATLADRAAVVRLRVDIATKARDVYGGASAALPEATVTKGTYGVFLGERAIAAVDTWWSTEGPLPAAQVQLYGLTPGQLKGRHVLLLDRVHVHPDHRARNPVEVLLDALKDAASRAGVGRIVGMSDLTAMPPFRATGFHSERPVDGPEGDEWFVMIADVEVAFEADPETDPLSTAPVLDTPSARASHFVLPPSLLPQLEGVVGAKTFFRVMRGARISRAPGAGWGVLLVLSGSVEVHEGGRHVGSVRAGTAQREPEPQPLRVLTGGPDGATALLLGMDGLRELIGRHPVLGAEVAVALIRGLVA